MESDLYEIWQAVWKRFSDQQLSLCHKVHPNFGEFVTLFSNFCFLNNFLLKSHNKIPLVLEGPLRLVVYNFVFNSILPFLVKFNILPPNLMISVN